MSLTRSISVAGKDSSDRNALKSSINEAVTDDVLKKILENQELAKELKVELPEKHSPLITLYDVPTSMSEEDPLGAIYEQNHKGRVRQSVQDWADYASTSVQVKDYVVVPKCTKGQDLGHVERHCAETDITCGHCGEQGHTKNDCAKGRQVSITSAGRWIVDNSNTGGQRKCQISSLAQRTYRYQRGAAGRDDSRAPARVLSGRNKKIPTRQRQRWRLATMSLAAFIDKDRDPCKRLIKTALAALKQKADQTQPKIALEAQRVRTGETRSAFYQSVATLEERTTNRRRPNDNPGEPETGEETKSQISLSTYETFLRLASHPPTRCLGRKRRADSFPPGEQ
ncbi:hypothetical protein ILUMI_01689 [Ignelater luminosus]|uniref:CCHC-type domain-containing protein n=1 Tax=Ignelater luminosus TaxID=2038154 RepID=A0A8K0GM06_IGNLU|nr:hypothetical protein ILUMI_01689 [Ignelater luminosus]